MKRNIQASFQVAFVSDLSDDDLKKEIIAAITSSMLSVKGAEPTGLYLITVEPGKEEVFPRIPPEEKFTSDLQMDRKRELEKHLKEEQMFNEQQIPE